MTDFICTVPIFLFYDNSHEKFWRLFFLLKIMRIMRGLEMLDVMCLMEKFKSYSDTRINDIIKNDHEKAEDTVEDNNNISVLIRVGILLKVFKLMVILAVISFYIGISFYIFSDLI